MTDGAAMATTEAPELDVLRAAAVVAFDPGRRVGVAWVRADGVRLQGCVIGIDDVAALPIPAAAAVVVGDGTGSRALTARLEALGLRPGRVDEVGTSERGRELYWRDHPPRGVARFLPVGLRVPPRDVDDYAAYAIALRALGLEGASRPRAPRP